MCNMSLSPWLRLHNGGDMKRELFIFVYNMQHCVADSLFLQK